MSFNGQSAGQVGGMAAGAGLGFMLGGPPGAMIGASLGGGLGGGIGGMFGGGGQPQVRPKDLIPGGKYNPGWPGITPNQVGLALGQQGGGGGGMGGLAQMFGPVADMLGAQQMAGQNRSLMNMMTAQAGGWTPGGMSEAGALALPQGSPMYNGPLFPMYDAGWGGLFGGGGGVTGGSLGLM